MLIGNVIQLWTKVLNNIERKGMVALIVQKMAMSEALWFFVGL